MLLANVAVAEELYKHFPSFALLRRHPTPTPTMLRPLVHAAKAAGFPMDTGSSKQLADSLDRIQKKVWFR